MRRIVCLCLLTLCSWSCAPAALRGPGPAREPVAADAVLEGRVAHAFHEAELAGWSRIRVTARRGVVHLESDARDEELLAAAATLARDVRGVLSVVVGPSPAGPGPN